MKIIDRYTISKWSENIDGVRWCKSDDVAKLETENEKYHQIVADMSNQLRQAAEEIRELKAYQHRILTCEEEE